MGKGWGQEHSRITYIEGWEFFPMFMDYTNSWLLLILLSFLIIFCKCGDIYTINFKKISGMINS